MLRYAILAVGEIVLRYAILAVGEIVFTISFMARIASLILMNPTTRI